MKGLFTHPDWLAQVRPSFSSDQKSWLMRPGPLTAGLRQIGQVRLDVISERPEGLSTDEAHPLSRPPRSAVWVREVLMSIDDVPCVFARSLTPLRASHGTWQGIRRLRNRPLADILYDEASIRRSAFEVARIQRHMPLHQIYRNLLLEQGTKTSSILARRSVFWRDKEPLLVSECFLPAFWRMLFAYYKK